MRYIALLIGDAPPNPVNTVAPSITETDGTATAVAGTWTGVDTVTGQWFADGVAETGETALTFDVSGLTDGDTYFYRETGTANGLATFVDSNTLTYSVPLAYPFRFGILSDLHYNSTKAVTGLGRYYQDGVSKLTDAVAVLNAQDLAFNIMNGDFIDHENDLTSEALADLATIEAVYDDLTAPRYYVLGNHDQDALTKAQFYAGTGMTEGYYFFDVLSTRIIVLDSNFESDSDSADYGAGDFDFNDTFINPAQRTWLSGTALNTSNDCIVVIHRRLDDEGPAQHSVDNASVVRGILEAAGNVRTVIQGHSHENNFITINGIDYLTTEGMTDGAAPENAYGIFTVTADGFVSLQGFGNQANITSSGGTPAPGTTSGNLTLGADQLTLGADSLVIGA